MGAVYLLSWRDIPAQVIATGGPQQVTRALSQRFQEAIRRAAEREGLSEGDEAYAAQWRRTELPTHETDPDAVVERIEQGFDPKMLAELSAANGRVGAGRRQDAPPEG